MSATNGIGYEIQVYQGKWVAEHTGFPTMALAQTTLDALPKDGKERRAYESLEGYP